MMNVNHKGAEGSLKEIKKRYKTLIEASPDAIFLTDLEENITGASKRAAELCGYGKPGELVGKNIIDIFHQEDQEGALLNFQKVLDESSLRNIEYKFVRKDGAQFMGEANTTLVEDNGGNPRGFMVAVRDITKYKDVEKSFREEMDRVQTYLDVAGVMLVVIDTSQRVGMINRKGLEILGYKEKDVVGKNWFDNFIPAEMRPEVKKVFDMLMSGEMENVEYFENSILNCQGEERTIAWHNEILRDGQGNITGTLSSGEDITEKVMAEKALRESEERFKDLFENANDLIQSIDSQGRFLYVNRKWIETLGYSQQEAKKMTFMDIIHTNHISHCISSFEKVCRRENIGQIETVFVSKDGREIPVEGNVNAHFTDGKLVGTRGIFRDITDRKRAEIDLKENKERLKTILNTIQTGIMIVDAESHEIVEVNPTAAKMFGADAQQIVGHVCHKFVCPAGKGACPITDLKLDVDNSERMLLGYDGRKIPILKTVTPIQLGGREHLLESFVDITQQKVSEEAIKRSEEKFRSVFQGVKEGIYISSPQGKFMDLNPAMLEIFGYSSKEEMLESDMNKNFFLNGDDGLSITKELEEKGSIKHRESILKKRDGSPIICSISIRVVKDEQGAIVRLEGMIRDITKIKTAERLLKDYSRELESKVEEKTSALEEQKKELESINHELFSTNDELDQAKKRLETYNHDLERRVKEKTRELQKALDDLKEMDRFKDDIVSNISHELKTPITIMQGCMELMFHEDDSSDRKEIKGMFFKALRRQEKIVNDLLVISHVGVIKPQKNPHDIKKLVEGVVEEKIPAANEKGVKIRMELPDESSHISLDREMIVHVFQDLIENAIKFNKRNGEVVIEGHKKENYFEISLADTGIGIAKNDMENIFKPLTQLDPSTRRKYGGTGSGLAVVKKIIDAHGGKIRAKSPGPGKGSKFTFTLPLDN